MKKVLSATKNGKPNWGISKQSRLNDQKTWQSFDNSKYSRKKLRKIFTRTSFNFDIFMFLFRCIKKLQLEWEKLFHKLFRGKISQFDVSSLTSTSSEGFGGVELVLGTGERESEFVVFSSSVWAGHSKWTQWKTSLAVLCVPVILIKTTGRLSKVNVCQDLQLFRVRSATISQSQPLIEVSI